MIAFPLALAALGGLFLFLGSKSKPTSPVAPSDGGAFIETVDGVVRVRLEARAWLLTNLATQYVGLPTTAGNVETAPLLAGGQNAQAWANTRHAAGRSVAISTSGTARLVAFPPHMDRELCRPGDGLAVLLEARGR